MDGLPKYPDDAHIVKEISGLARGMGFNLLAEGIETEEQLAFVRDQLDCHVIQGFHISSPLSKQQQQNSQFYSDYTPPAL
ncbi:MAG: EAL domain-containing protein [Neptuniibacter sp.]|nr:EAL domain-containing protein [Neptuniibacter sp.]